LKQGIFDVKWSTVKLCIKVVTYCFSVCVNGKFPSVPAIKQMLNDIRLFHCETGKQFVSWSSCIVWHKKRSQC